MSRIFINYRRLDSEGYVGRLYDHLLKQFKPDDIFMDVQNIEPGADFVTVLDEAVSACDIFLAMIGPHWGKLKNEEGERRLEEWNDFVRIELETALKHGKIVIPILVGGAGMPNPNTLPESILPLSRRNAFKLTHNRFTEDVEALVEFMRGLLPSHPTFKRKASADALAEKETAIKQVRVDLLNAKDSPLYAYRNEQRYYPVLGEGYPDANIMIIGEAPGKNEAETGKPFVGPSGEVLDDLLATIDLSRDDVFMTNILLDRAPDNRDPNKEELEYYGVYLDRMIDIVQPRVIVTLGRFSMTYILRKFGLPEKTSTISKLHGKLIRTESHYGDLHVMPMYHPAMVLYNPSKKDVLRADFEKLTIFI
ncbi:MAG: uracil-DNA glycosylase family protein [Phototrophicaceae bacterium]